MKLSFRDLKQNKFVIEAEPSDLISDVKDKIASEKGWEASTQKLIYSGKILQDSNTVESYKIEEKGFIVCMTSKPKVSPAASSTSISAKPVTATSSLQIPQPNADITAAATPIASNTATALNSTPSNNAELASSGFSTAAERHSKIAELESMGFERSQIDSAMRAAFFNSERAVEYLINGIPENLRLSAPNQAVIPAMPDPNPTAAPGTETESAPRNLFDAAAALGVAGARGGGAAGATTGGAVNFNFLRNSPQFQQIRQVVQQQPHMLETILQQVGAGNPELASLIGDHSQQFLQLLSEEADPDAALPPGTQPISVTEDERAAIERLCRLGFPRDLAIQAYFAFEKNEELAANFLFDQPDTDEQ